MANIIVTGASKGIGKAIALEFAHKGNHCLLLTAKSDYENLFDVGMTIKKNQKPDCCSIATIDIADVSKFNECEETVDRFVKHFGKIDYVINNAGIIRDRTLKNMSKLEWDDVIGTNLTGIFNMCKATLPHMNPNGCIVNITSIIGIKGAFGQVNYAASKAGVIGLTKALSKETARDHIRVNALACGYVDTQMTRNILPEIKENILNSIPLKRFAQPEEIAKTVRFICEDGTYMTGSIITVDGGLT